MNLLTQMSFVAGDCLPVLTGSAYHPIIQPLSALSGSNEPGNLFIRLSHQKVRHALFFRLFRMVSSHFNSIMAGFYEQPSGWQFDLIAVFPDSSNSAANVLENKSSGLNPQIRSLQMNTQFSGETEPQIPLKQTSIADLLIHALQELSHIETLSCLDCDSSCILPSIFQHSQRGLNALHDLKNRLSIENLQA